MALFKTETRSLAEDVNPKYEDSPEDNKMDALMEKLNVAQRRQVLTAVTKMVGEMLKGGK